MARNARPGIIVEVVHRDIGVKPSGMHTSVGIVGGGDGADRTIGAAVGGGLGGACAHHQQEGDRKLVESFGLPGHCKRL